MNEILEEMREVRVVKLVDDRGLGLILSGEMPENLRELYRKMRVKFPPVVKLL